MARSPVMSEKSSARGCSHENANIVGFWRAAALGIGSVILPGGQLAEPVEKGAWFDDQAALATFVRGEQFSCGSKATALVLGEWDLLAAGRGREFFPEDEPFLFDLVELALQLVVDRGSDHHDDESQRLGQHLHPPCPSERAFPSCLFLRFRESIPSPMIFRTLRAGRPETPCDGKPASLFSFSTEKVAFTPLPR
jgi:hypothetical protein